MRGVSTQLASALCCFQEGFSLLPLCSDGSAKVAWGRTQCCSRCVHGQPHGLEAWGEELGLGSVPRSIDLAEEEREVPKARQQAEK